MAPSHLAMEDIGTLIHSRSMEEGWTPDTIVGGYNSLSIVLSNGQLRDRFPDDPEWASLEEAGAVIAQMVECVHGTEALPGAVDLLLSLSAFLPGRRLFSTKAGHVGLAPLFAQSGDSVCAILGCPSLIVLRPSQNGHYRVVGHCLLYGFMDLDALLGPLPSNFHVEEGDDGAWAYDM